MPQMLQIQSSFWFHSSTYLYCYVHFAFLFFISQSSIVRYFNSLTSCFLSLTLTPNILPQNWSWAQTILFVQHLSSLAELHSWHDTFSLSYQRSPRSHLFWFSHTFVHFLPHFNNNPHTWKNSQLPFSHFCLYFHLICCASPSNTKTFFLIYFHYSSLR